MIPAIEGQKCIAVLRVHLGSCCSFRQRDTRCWGIIQSILQNFPTRGKAPPAAKIQDPNLKSSCGAFVRVKPASF